MDRQQLLDAPTIPNLSLADLTLPATAVRPPVPASRSMVRALGWTTLTLVALGVVLLSAFAAGGGYWLIHPARAALWIFMLALPTWGILKWRYSRAVRRAQGARRGRHATAGRHRRR